MDRFEHVGRWGLENSSPSKGTRVQSYLAMEACTLSSLGVPRVISTPGINETLERKHGRFDFRLHSFTNHESNPWELSGRETVSEAVPA